MATGTVSPTGFTTVTPTPVTMQTPGAADTTQNMASASYGNMSPLQMYGLSQMNPATQQANTVNALLGTGQGGQPQQAGISPMAYAAMMGSNNMFS